MVKVFNIKMEIMFYRTLIIFSEFELEYLLLEGHAWDISLGTPPRGLQLILGTRENPELMDTIVMANLGYFQLKANPGAWILRLRPGRSEEIYEVIGCVYNTFVAKKYTILYKSTSSRQCQYYH